MTIVKTKIMEGPRKAIFHFYLESDGVFGELSNEILLDPTVDFNPEETSSLQYSITKIWSSLAVFDVILKFNALEPYTVWVVTPENDSDMCFDYFGGLKDRSTAAHDGKLLISTSGFTPVGSAGVLIVEIRKD